MLRLAGRVIGYVIRVYAVAPQAAKRKEIMYKGHDEENYSDLSDPVENFRYLMDLTNQALFNPYIPPPLPENKLVSKQKLNIGTLHLDAPNIKDLDEVARNIRPELERAIYDFDILPRIERPDCIPPEITMNFAMIGVQTDATDARGLADAIIARMRDLFVEEINRQANHAAFYKEKNGWWPWEEGQPGPHAAEIKALFPDMVRNPQDEGIYWFDEMLVCYDDSPPGSGGTRLFPGGPRAPRRPGQGQEHGHRLAGNL